VKPRVAVPCLALAILAAAGCGPDASPTAPGVHLAVPGPLPALSLVPGVVLHFSFANVDKPPMEDGVEGREPVEWRSSELVDAEGRPAGSLTVLTTSAGRNGETLHLTQTWDYMPEGGTAPDTQLELRGALNLASGRLVLNSHPPTPGLEEGGNPPDDSIVHVTGWAVFHGDGTMDLAGALSVVGGTPPHGD
jgi:hypothetical protein